MHKELNRKLLKIIILFVLCLMLANIAGLVFPPPIYCNTYCYDEYALAASIENNRIDNNIMTEANPAASENNDKFYPILITSCVVLGVLIFAMWQTFKSKRHI
jgi:hypothetical protein